MPQRFFVALSLPLELREALARLHIRNDSVRWTSVPQMHLTLRFIGPVDDDMVARLSRALANITARPFDVQIRGTGTFDNRILWAGVAENPALAALQARVEMAVREAGFEPEGRPFHAHVTLARLKGRAGRFTRRFLEENRDLSLPPFEAGSFELYRSTLHPKGAKYDVVESFPLAGVPE